MPNTITVKPNQSALDVALTACGTLEGALQIMAANNKSISYNEDTGTEYTIPDGLKKDSAALAYMRHNQIEIGTKG